LGAFDLIGAGLSISPTFPPRRIPERIRLSALPPAG